MEGAQASLHPEQQANETIIRRELAKIKLDHLSPSDRQAARSVLWKHKSLFDIESGGCKTFVARIRPKTEDIIFSPQFRLPKPQADFTCTEIPKLIKTGVLVPTSSPWNSPCLAVQKPHPQGPHDPRMVVDFRKLNKALANTMYAHFPRIPEILDSLSGSRVFRLAL